MNQIKHSTKWFLVLLLAFFASIIASKSFATSATTSQALPTIKAGVDYIVLDQPATPNKQVVMVMSLTCLHCAEFTNKYRVPAKVTELLKKYPDGQFKEVHFYDGKNTIFGDFARVKVILDLAHKDQYLPEAYDLIYTYRNDPTPLQEFLAAKLNWDLDKVKNVWNSFSVKTMLKKDAEFTKRYNIVQTPTFIINGKYQLRLEGLQSKLNSKMQELNRQLTPEDIGDIVSSTIAAIVALPNK